MQADHGKRSTTVAAEEPREYADEEVRSAACLPVCLRPLAGGRSRLDTPDAGLSGKQNGLQAKHSSTKTDGVPAIYPCCPEVNENTQPKSRAPLMTFSTPRNATAQPQHRPQVERADHDDSEQGSPALQGVRYRSRGCSCPPLHFSRTDQIDHDLDHVGHIR